jgi:hypothetical protein
MGLEMVEDLPGRNWLELSMNRRVGRSKVKPKVSWKG